LLITVEHWPNFYLGGGYETWTFPQIFSPLESWTVGSTKLFPYSRILLAQIPQISRQKKNTLRMAKSMYYIKIKRKRIADCLSKKLV
jgi:hypothetical protein